jgi:beta-phosphoglucomutase-like phosphatase (HAD superfamily)
MINISKITKLLIFDCDGTISDSTYIHNRAWHAIAKRYNFSIPEGELEKNNGIPTLTILRRLTSGMKLSVDLSTIVAEKESIAYNDMHNALPIKSIINLVHYYNKKLPMMVISGGARKNVMKTLSTMKIDTFFDCIITADDNHPFKHSPDSFIIIAKKFGLRCDECHVFEDGKLGLINAIKANMTVTDARTLY